MTQASAVTAEVYQNEYLPRDSTVVDAVVTVTSTQGAASGRAPARPRPRPRSS